MCIDERIEQLFDKNAYLIDIFPERVPEKSDGRYFDVERYFQQNRSCIDRSFINVILKLYCYCDVIAVTQDGKYECPETEKLIDMLERCLCGETGFVNMFLPEYDALIALNRDDLYMTVYNADGKLVELIARLVSAEGLFFYEVPQTD